MSRRVLTHRKPTHSTELLLGVIILLAAISFPGLAYSQSTKPDKTVNMRDIQFHPSQIEAEKGDRIRFTNNDPFEHDVYVVQTANQNDVVVARTTVNSGQSVTVTIDETGLFDLYCTIHGGMSGKITTTGKFELSEAEKKRAARQTELPPIVKQGEKLFWGKAQCHQCHRLGDRGQGRRGPNLQAIGLRASGRAQKLGLSSGTEYITQSLLQPSAHIVQGFSDDMPKVYHEPIGLTRKQVKAIITYLQSQGGQVDTWAIDIDQALFETRPHFNPFKDGDPQAGKQVFAKMGCFSCHAGGNQSPVSPGPDLSDIGAFRNWTWLAESIINPNAEIGANWRTATATLKTGQEITGVLSENSRETVKLLVGPDKIKTINADKVSKVTVSEQSKMPTGYPDMLTFKQMADLIAFLEAQRGKTQSE